MPKKFVGENSKATAARLRKETTREAAKALKKQQEEDEYWRDDDKLVNRKINRKEVMEQKKAEQRRKKQENEILLHNEELANHSTRRGVAAHKVTRAELEAEQEKLARARRQQYPAGGATRDSLVVQEAVSENTNRGEVVAVSARTVDEAISALSITREEDLERHPERRLKAAYKAFEEENLARLRKLHPSMRLSQVKQLLFKEWTKSGQNPLNRQYCAYNEK